MSVTFTLAESLFVGILYWLAYAEVSAPLPFVGVGIQDASTIGLLIGIFYGNPTQGAILGCSIALMYIANGAVGANLPSDGVLAACIAVPIAIKANLPVETAVALAVPFGVLGVFIDTGRRLVNGVWNRRAVADVNKRDYSKLWIYGILGPQLVFILFRVVPLTALLYLFGAAAADIVAKFPTWLNSGLGLIASMLPGLGLVLCTMFMGKKQLLPYFFIGYYIVYFTHTGYFFVAIIGAIIAILHVQFVGYTFEDDEDEDDEEEVEVRTDIYGEGHAFKSRLDCIWQCYKFFLYFRMSQCIEYFYGTGVGLWMKKLLKRVYGNDEDAYQTAMLRHYQPFITNPSWGHELLTASIAMEEDIARNGDPDGSKGSAIETLKTSMMGPMAGLGDGIECGIWMPLWKALSYPLGMQGKWYGCWPMFLWFLPMTVVGLVTGVIGYEQGQKGLLRLLNSSLIKKFLFGAGIVGILMMGAMAAGYCTVPLNLVINGGEIGGMVDVLGILNSIIPGFLPLLYLIIAYVLLNRGVKFTNIIIFTVIFGLICGLLGIC